MARGQPLMGEHALPTYYAYNVGGWACGLVLALLAAKLGEFIGTLL